MEQITTTIVKKNINIFWFRRDLRLADNVGLFKALSAGIPVLPIFIFDEEILNSLKDPADRRVGFIHQTVTILKERIAAEGGQMEVHHGKPKPVFQHLVQKYAIQNVFVNNDYEPYARKRDQQIIDLLAQEGIKFQSFKDQVILEKSEVLKDDGKPYTVFTPYSRKWKSILTPKHLETHDSASLIHNFLKGKAMELPSLKDLGFQKGENNYPPNEVSEALINNYSKTRDFPGIAGTSRLGLHLRFGTISTRRLVRQAMNLSETFWNELIWREFFQMILWHFPKVVDRCFKVKYEAIEWRNNEIEFKAWCEGKTGYPMVDAGMRELNATGFMHNRVRMVTASFLCKHLLIDWRWGEAYFAEKLLDYELASNNGNWQWAAGTGCDAAPYFRIFNPESQAKKFDKTGAYIRKWIPEFDTFDYPKPIVEHKAARERALAVYKQALQ